MIAALLTLTLILGIPAKAGATQEPMEQQTEAGEAVQPQAPVGEAAPDAVTQEESSQPEGLPGTTVYYATADAELRTMPTQDGEAVGTLKTGDIINVYMMHVNGEWCAVITDDGALYYVHQSVIAAEAPPYAYSYMSDLTRTTGYNGVQLEKALTGTGLVGLGWKYAEVESTYGVSALFLIAIAKLESASGSSPLATGRNNLGGLKTDSGYLSFGSREECVEYMAQLLSADYLTPGGRFYNGPTSKDVARIYCVPPDTWYPQVENLMKSSYEQIVA